MLETLSPSSKDHGGRDSNPSDLMCGLPLSQFLSDSPDLSFKNKGKNAKIFALVQCLNGPVSPFNTGVVQTQKASSLTPFSSSKNGRQAWPQFWHCSDSGDSRYNDQKQVKKKKQYKTRYSKEWQKMYSFLKACSTYVQVPRLPRSSCLQLLNNCLRWSINLPFFHH